MATNSTYYPGDLRGDLLNAAVEVIDEKGIAALSLREVARRVGVSHAAPAHHFGDKAGLFTALATDSFDQFALAMREAVIGVGESDALGRLDAAGIAYLEFALSNRSRFELMFRPEVLTTEDDEYIRAARQTSTLLHELVAASQAAGWAPERETDSVVLAMWGMVHGLSTLANQGNLAGWVTQEDRLDAAIGAVQAFRLSFQ